MILQKDFLMCMNHGHVDKKVQMASDGDVEKGLFNP